MTSEAGWGTGLDGNVVEAYNFLSLNYESSFRPKPGGGPNELVIDRDQSDEIFLFGFSRGAYTVRALAGLISSAGILKKNSIQYFPAMYSAFQKRKVGQEIDKEEVKKQIQKIFPSANLEFEVENEDVRIKVIGCWDTVGSLGVPDAWFASEKVRTFINREFAFHDPQMSRCECLPLSPRSRSSSLLEPFRC